jgi:hypothetical protein
VALSLIGFVAAAFIRDVDAAATMVRPPKRGTVAAPAERSPAPGPAEPSAEPSP